jgi:methionyl aminopeptidase
MVVDCQVCGETSTLRCPTCLKQGLADSFFCSQTCFKDSWSSHKSIHKSTKKLYNPWPNYPYTGQLRPVYPLSKKRFVPEEIVRPDYAGDGMPRSEQRKGNSSTIEVLDAVGIEKMRTVCRLSREILEEGRKAVRVGITTDEIDRVVHEASIGIFASGFINYSTRVLSKSPKLS